jgi:hypothetical protein
MALLIGSHPACAGARVNGLEIWVLPIGMHLALVVASGSAVRALIGNLSSTALSVCSVPKIPVCRQATYGASWCRDATDIFH